MAFALQLGGPFDFCAFALLSDCGHSQPRAWLSGNRFEVYSSSSAFLFYCWAVFYDGGERMSRGRRSFSFTSFLIRKYFPHRFSIFHNTPSILLAHYF